MRPEGKKRTRAARPRPTRKNSSTAQGGTATLFVLPAFLVLCAVVALLWKPAPWFPLVYLAASLATFCAYWMDKSAARSGGWRTRESTLHLFALLGGWPGALLAQQVLRHKSSKATFRSAFWATVALNVAAFVFLCSPLRRLVWPVPA